MEGESQEGIEGKFGARKKWARTWQRNGEGEAGVEKGCRPSHRAAVDHRCPPLRFKAKTSQSIQAFCWNFVVGVNSSHLTEGAWCTLVRGT